MTGKRRATLRRLRKALDPPGLGTDSFRHILRFFGLDKQREALKLAARLVDAHDHRTQGEAKRREARRTARAMALTAYLRRASVGGAATAFDDDVGLLVKHGRSEDEGGSGATRSRGRSRRKAGQASAQRMIEEIGVCTGQGRCSTSCASCRPPPNSEAGLESHSF